MNKAVITPASYPLLNSIFVRPSLLEIKVSLEALGAPISVVDPSELKQLTGSKADKYAKRWVPLFVHNLLQGKSLDDAEVVGVLNRAEDRLKRVSGTSWAAAFRSAGEIGIAPSAMISKMPTEAKAKLHAEVKTWREAAKLVEKELAAWAVSAGEKIKASYAAMNPEDGGVSLKKMAKFTPRAI